MDSLLKLRYRQMAIDNQAILSPVGALWKYIRTTYPEINLYSTDGSHPSLEGSYAAACCMIAAMLRTDPYLITYSSTLEPVVAEKIKLAAQEVVFDNLLEWHVYNSSGSYVLSYSAIDACGRTAQGSFDIQMQENNIEEIKCEYRVRNLENGFMLDFNFPVTSITVYDLNGRLMECSQKNQNIFFLEKSSSPKIIQFIMNGISHRILLGV